MKLRMPWVRRPDSAVALRPTVWVIQTKGAMLCAIEYDEHADEPTGRACAARTPEQLTGMLRKMNLRTVAPWHPSYRKGTSVWLSLWNPIHIEMWSFRSFT
jgi:hypothetical protein